MTFCTPHILSFFKKGPDLFNGLAGRIPFVLPVQAVLARRKQLQIPRHNYKSSRLHRAKSADTILVERGERFGVTEPSSLAIARNGDSDGTGGEGRLEALNIGD